MESNDRDFILKMREVDIRLKRLYDEHERLEDELGQLSTRTYLTSSEEAHERQLKFKKLRGVEKMMEIVSSLRAAA